MCRSGNINFTFNLKYIEILTNMHVCSLKHIYVWLYPNHEQSIVLKLIQLKNDV